jgi:RNA polymerase sigma factor (sigma-70 family)
MSPGIPTRLLATQSDQRLLALVREGHERAFEALVHRYRKPLLSYCRRLALPEARAEDVVQQALLKAWLALREGAEVRELRAWLYRVVHNTAVNAVRSAHDRDLPLEDPAQMAGAGEVGLERGLLLREALAEVAALPLLQREVIVRTAVAGHSHEQVASDLGISDGAVRGLLYRARVTLRTAVTALTPPPLLNWIAGAASPAGPAPERLTELTAGGGAAGLAGLLVKGGAVALTAGTLVAGAVAVHSQAPVHHRDSRKLATAAAPHGETALVVPAGASSGALHEAAAGREPRRAARRHASARHKGSVAPIHVLGVGDSVAHSPSASGRQPTPTAQRRPKEQSGPPGAGSTGQDAAPQSAPAQGNGQASGGSQAGESAGGASAGPVGSVASNGAGDGSGSAGSAGAGGESAPQGGDASGGGSSGSGGSQGGSGGSGGGSGDGAGGSGGGAEGSGSQGDSSGSSESKPAGGSGSGQSGSLVGTVVHEVGGLVEHLLH